MFGSGKKRKSTLKARVAKKEKKVKKMQEKAALKAKDARLTKQLADLRMRV